VELAVGIDVGLSAKRPSAGAVILDRASQTIAAGSRPRVDNAQGVADYVVAQIARLEPSSVICVIDGPFAPALAPAKVRFVERFFSSGPFASTPPNRGLKLRVMPAPTAAGSQFLASTRLIVDRLVRAGYTEMKLAGSTASGNVVEIFPTIFMAALLPPHPYQGKRGKHTDELWLKLIGESALNGVARVCPGLHPYQSLIALVESSKVGQLHDLRAAAISAIAADWFAASPPGSGTSSATMFIGHSTEYGFLLPPRTSCDDAFLAMLETHWRNTGGLPLTWI
jgi:hypothetical protein